MPKERADRAKQFMPFAALKGYYDLVRERERITEPKRELSEEEAMAISRKLAQVGKGDMVRVIHYDTDAYAMTEGMVASVDTVFRVLTIVKTRISFEDILDIEGDSIEVEVDF